jgi:hypothetical protein
MPMREKVRGWALGNEVTLTISYKRKQPMLGTVEDFLTEALIEFKKRQKLQEPPGLDNEFWDRRIPYGRDVFLNCSLTHAPDIPGHYLSDDDWVKVIARAHSAVNTTIDIAEQIDAFAASATGWLIEVVAAMRDLEGELDAFGLVLNHVNGSDFHRS